MPDLGDVVELTTDIPERRLTAGMQGTIVHSHGDEAYEVEFTNRDGETTECLALEPEQFIVAWRSETREWVPLADQASALVARLPEEAANEVLAFARSLSSRRQLDPQLKPVPVGGPQQR